MVLYSPSPYTASSGFHDVHSPSYLPYGVLYCASFWLRAHAAHRNESAISGQGGGGGGVGREAMI
jgi:hypothetical protein